MLYRTDKLLEVIKIMPVKSLHGGMKKPIIICNNETQDKSINVAKSNNSEFLNSEFIGSIYEKSLVPEERKSTGQYYTPRNIVEYIIDQLDIKKNSKILDPACGCGSFLTTIQEIFCKMYGESFINNIYGVDINEEAVKITRKCLYSQISNHSIGDQIIDKNIKIGNSIVTDKTLNKKGFNWFFEFSDIFKHGGFDFVIGNPPYLLLKKSDFNSKESIYSQLINGVVNAATLFIGRSLEVLKPKGTLAFLLPKSILYVDSYLKLRNYLINDANIIQIVDLGSHFINVRGEQIIMIIRKEPSNWQAPIKIKFVNKLIKNNSQNDFIEVHKKEAIINQRILTLDEIYYYKLIRKLSFNYINFNNYVKGNIFRGLPIESKDLIQSDSTNGLKVIRGKNISRFSIKESINLDLDIIKRLNTIKINKMKQKKIVIQNIFSSESGVIAAYDDQGYCTLDTVTNVLIKDEIQGKYLLALLNSKLINFFLIYGIFNKSKLTMHLDKSYLGMVPIVLNPPEKSVHELKKIVDQLIGSSNISMVKILCKKIDEIIYELYSISKKDILLINKAIDNVFSRKSTW